MKVLWSLAFAAAVTLAACSGGGPGGNTIPGGNGGGGGGPTPTPTTSATPTPSSLTAQQVIQASDAIGSPIKAFQTFERTDIDPVSIGTPATGVCSNGVKYNVPDTSSDPNSTEIRYYYDAACTYIARDIVRIYTINGNAETVQENQKQYPYTGSVSPSLGAQRLDTVNIESSSYNSAGYPSIATGFSRLSSGFLNIGSQKTVVSNYELVVGAASGSSNTFCMDEAGYNALGVGSLGNTFGWRGVVSLGSRTVNGDGSITWTGEHDGQTYLAGVGLLGIGISSANTSCPITKPAYTITGGGNPQGTHKIPYQVTFTNGLMTSLSVTNATLSNGLSLNVTTAPGSSGQGSIQVSGTLSSSSGTVATFSVDAFGDGKLTMSSSGTQFTITDWHVH